MLQVQQKYRQFALYLARKDKRDLLTQLDQIRDHRIMINQLRRKKEQKLKKKAILDVMVSSQKSQKKKILEEELEQKRIEDLKS